MTDDAGRREQYAAVFGILAEVYGLPVWRSHGPPLDELIGTILSQATADVNTARAYAELTARFPTWEAVMDAPSPAVSAAIRSAGLSQIKGPRIQNALRHIQRERGALSLDFLGEMPLDEALAWLMQIDGVGPKTAAIVMLFSLGRTAFPVDTHVHRVAGRLGLIPPRTSAAKAHDLLAALGPPETYYPLHINFIRHGREICRARNPHCHLCPLQDLCDDYLARAADA